MRIGLILLALLLCGACATSELGSKITVGMSCSMAERILELHGAEPTELQVGRDPFWYRNSNYVLPDNALVTVTKSTITHKVTGIGLLRRQDKQYGKSLGKWEYPREIDLRDFRP